MYRGADILTPNLSEFRLAGGDASSDAAMLSSARAMLNRCGIAAMLLTRSEQGMTLITATEHHHFPAQVLEVSDVTGAGDTVIATLAVMLGTGMALPQAVEMALTHLEQRGYRDVLLVTEPYDGTSSRIERVSSFQAQIAQRSELAGAVLETGDDLNAQLQSFLNTPGDGPKALFCANGVAALAATTALRQMGCRLFEDVGLIALDDLDWYPLVGSGITALAQPTAEIGARAFECERADARGRYRRRAAGQRERLCQMGRFPALGLARARRCRQWPG